MWGHHLPSAHKQKGWCPPNKRKASFKEDDKLDETQVLLSEELKAAKALVSALLEGGEEAATPAPMELHAARAITCVCSPSSPFHEALVACGISGWLSCSRTMLPLSQAQGRKQHARQSRRAIKVSCCFSVLLKSWLKVLKKADEQVNQAKTKRRHIACHHFACLKRKRPKAS